MKCTYLGQQEQVRLFRQMVEEADQLIGHRTGGTIHDILLEAKRILSDLNHLLTEKLLRRSDGLDRARRGAWLMNKARIMTLRDELKDARLNLSVALTMQLMSVQLSLSSQITITDGTFQSTSSPCRVITGSFVPANAAARAQRP
jgi:hypothetical protein